MIFQCLIFDILKYLDETRCLTTANLPIGSLWSVIKPHHPCIKPEILGPTATLQGVFLFEFTTCNFSDVPYDVFNGFKPILIQIWLNNNILVLAGVCVCCFFKENTCSKTAM